MPLYNPGQTVYATETITTEATGDRPYSLHDNRGDALVVLESTNKDDYPYLVANNPEGKEPFYVKISEIMGQKPFIHNARG